MITRADIDWNFDDLDQIVEEWKAEGFGHERVFRGASCSYRLDEVFSDSFFLSRRVIRLRSRPRSNRLARVFRSASYWDGPRVVKIRDTWSAPSPGVIANQLRAVRGVWSQR